MTVSRLQVTKAVRALLETGTGKPCGHGRLPTTAAGAAATAPYTVLYLVGGDLSGPPLGDDGDTAELLYQVTSVGGARPDQAEWMGDKACEVLVGKTPAGAFLHPLEVAGLRVLARRLAEDVGVSSEGGTVSHVARYTVTVTGA